MFPQDWWTEGETHIQMDTVRREASLSGWLAGGDPVRLTDKACGEADTDVSPIRQKIYGKTFIVTTVQHHSRLRVGE